MDQKGSSEDYITFLNWVIGSTASFADMLTFQIEKSGMCNTEEYGEEKVHSIYKTVTCSPEYLNI